MTEESRRIARLEVATDAPPPGWDDIVRRLDGNVFHTTAWADYQRSVRHVRPVFLLGRDAHGQECAAVLAFFQRSSRPLLSLLLRDLSLSAHPIALGADPVAIAEMLARSEALARSWGCARLRLDSFMSGDSPLVPGEHGYAESHRIEFGVDLAADTASLWHALRKDQREKIRRLHREGISLGVGATLEDLGQLRDAREATRERRSLRGPGYEPSSAELYPQLYHHLLKRGAGRLFVARAGGDVVAALFFATFNGRACSIFSGSTELGYRMGAQSGLYWTAVETFKAEGFRELNRGGVPASAARDSDPLHGIYQFKLRLGTTPRLCRSGQKILSPGRYRMRLLMDRLRRRAEESV